jgi:hypothetical protein
MTDRNSCCRYTHATFLPVSRSSAATTTPYEPCLYGQNIADTAQHWRIHLDPATKGSNPGRPIQITLRSTSPSRLRARKRLSIEAGAAAGLVDKVTGGAGRSEVVARFSILARLTAVNPSCRAIPCRISQIWGTPRFSYASLQAIFPCVERHSFCSCQKKLV